MAGIGFVLRKLYRQDDLTGLFKAGIHSAFASTGPWLFTVCALGGIMMLSQDIDQQKLFDFRTILIYNFSFSLIISGPILMICTRYLSDCIYRHDVTPVPGMLLGALILLWSIEAILGGVFYLLYAHLDFWTSLSSLLNLLLVSAVWLINIFISALKNYQLVTKSFLCGMMLAVMACLGLVLHYGIAGMLNGFSMGLALIIALLTRGVLIEYPYDVKNPFDFLEYFRKYWEIAASGFVYSTAVWVDKWIMWFAPEATRLENGLRVYPYYDSAMFIAYLTTIPAMALFLFNSETSFFEHYTKFYKDIQDKANFAKITSNQQGIYRSIFGSAGYFFLLQGSIAIICMVLAPEIVAHVKGSYLQIGILRYGLLGALFHVLSIFLMVLLSYFDNRKDVLIIQCIFLVTNTLFTWASMMMGFQYYGYGYFLSSFITFVLAAVMVRRHVAMLPYHTFITTNSSVA